MFPEQYVEPREYLDFLQEVLALAEQEKVFRVVRTATGRIPQDRYPEKYWVYQAQPDGPTYSQFLEEAFSETGEIVFSRQICSSPGFVDKDLWVYAATLLSYYDRNGQLVEREVDNLGALLRQLRPAEELINPELPEKNKLSEKKLIESYQAHGSAIFFRSSKGSDLVRWEELETWNNLPEEVRKDKDEPSVSKAYLVIEIYSDIWLPKVLGVLDDVLPNDPPLHDNRELALRHTPRLNRFLQGVKKLIEQRGGTWEADECDTSRYYTEMIGDEGIILDA